MNVGSGNVADLAFECSICKADGYTRGQFGGHSLVESYCPSAHVFHLECITRWLETVHQLVISLDKRQCCICRQPALPLIRMNDMRILEDESPYCETRIFNACRTGNLRELRKLLREDGTLANRTYYSVTTAHPAHLLAIAIKNEHTDLVRLLIDYHADVNAVEHDGETPLYIAAQKRRTEDFHMLIKAGADINNVLRTAIGEGDAPLLGYLISTEPGQLALNNALRDAAGQGQTQCLEILIRAGANNLDDALCAAAGRGQTQCLTPLIEAGVNTLNRALYIAVLSENIEARPVLERHGANIITVIHTAAREGSLELFNLPLDPGHVNETDEEGQTPLHITAANGHGGCLERVLEISTEKVNARNNSGETALHLAVYNGHVRCLKLLIENGANLNATNKNGETALHLATKININEGHQRWHGMINETLVNGRTPEHYTNKQGNDDECLKELVDNRGVNINVTDNDGVTPLIIAALWGKFDRLTWLIEAGADINTAAKCGTTALGAAACWGRIDCLRKLLDMEADINANSCKDGATPLNIAAAQGRTEVVKVLLAHRRILLLVNEKTKGGCTALHFAALHNSPKTARELVSAGINVNEKNNDGRTALHFAAVHTSPETVRVLVSATGISVNEKENKGGTALHLAALHSPENVKVLVSATGINVNEKNNDGRTALHFAAIHTSPETVQELMSASGTNVNEKDNNGWTALHVAARYASPETVKELVSASGINVNEKDNNGWTALHVAARYASPETVQVLVSASGINVNEKDNNGWTALHVAARYASPETVKVLVSASGINVNEKNNDGCTALDLAWKCGSSESKKLLEDKGAVYHKETCAIQ